MMRRRRGEGSSADQPPAPAAEEIEAAQASVSTPTPVTETESPRRLPGEKAKLQPPVVVIPTDLSSSRTHASPSVRRFARELGADLSQTKGSGNKGRITRDECAEPH